jgi:hypothetical protein
MAHEDRRRPSGAAEICAAEICAAEICDVHDDQDAFPLPG